MRKLLDSLTTLDIPVCNRYWLIFDLMMISNALIWRKNACFDHIGTYLTENWVLNHLTVLSTCFKIH